MTDVPAGTWVVLIDELVTRPGEGKATFDAYLERYGPGAEARGMTLVQRLVEPAFWLEDRSNRLLFVWTLPGAGAVWAKNFTSREDPAVEQWWQDCDAMVESRRRSVLAEAADIEALTNV
jgi:hypothetical protein